MVFRKCSAQCVLYFLRLLKYTVPTQILQKGSARVHGEYFIAHTLTGLHIRHTCDTIPSPTKTARELPKVVTKRVFTFSIWVKNVQLVERGCKRRRDPVASLEASREKILLFIDSLHHLGSASVRPQ